MADYWGADMAQGTCSIEGCGGTRRGREWCSKHYQRWAKFGDPLGSAPPREHRKTRSCTVDGCPKPVSCRDYCDRHYTRWLRHGDPTQSRDLRGDERPAICDVEDCVKRVAKVRWCGMHYQRLRIYGSLADPRITEEERFWRYVDKDGPIAKLKPELGRCWLWTGGNSSGYGRFKRKGRRVSDVADRVLYEWTVGPIPEGMHLDHFACENPPCVRPTHVRPVTVRENLLRSEITIAATNLAKTHCPQGHPYAGENLYLIPEGGGRVCRTCSRESDRRLTRARQATPRKSAADKSVAGGAG